MQTSLAVQHCKSTAGISIWVAVWKSLHFDAGCAYLEGFACFNFCASLLQVTACSSGFLVTEHSSPDQHFQLVFDDSKQLCSWYECQQAPTCHQSFAQKNLQNSSHTCCKEPCINAYSLRSSGMAC